MPDLARRPCILLGVIEGVTEFLPISSTGHLLLAENSHWLPQQSDLFNITIQSGAALAVLFAFSARVRQLSRGWASRPDRAATRQAPARLRHHRRRAGCCSRRPDSPLPKEIGAASRGPPCSGRSPSSPSSGRCAAARPGREITWARRGDGGPGPAARRGVPGHVARPARDHPIAPARSARPTGRHRVLVPASASRSPLLAAGLSRLQHALRHPAPTSTDWGLLALGTVVSAVTALRRGVSGELRWSRPTASPVRLVPHRPRLPCPRVLTVTARTA